MDYISQYYKNLSEQLKEKLSNLENQLNEYYVPKDPVDPEDNEYSDTKGGKYPKDGKIYEPLPPKAEKKETPKLYSDKFYSDAQIARREIEKMLSHGMEYGMKEMPDNPKFKKYKSEKIDPESFNASYLWDKKTVDAISKDKSKKMVEESVKYINKKFLKESDPDPMAEAGARHQDIVNALIDVHASKYPHRRKKDMTPAEASAEHIREVLNKHPSAPFTKVEDAVRAVAPHAIEGNYGLESRIYDEYPEYAISGDVSEHPHYERWVMENEESYMDDLMGELEKRLG